MNAEVLSGAYGKDKWERQTLRKKIEKNREIGVYFRKKKNKTWKHKLQKRRRSKRRNLFDNGMSHIMENIDDYSDLFQNHNVTNYSYEQYQVCDYELTQFSHISFEREKAIHRCIVCNQFKSSSNWNVVRCKECKKYLSQQTKINLEKYRICEACFPKTGLCKTHRKSKFCTQLTKVKCSARSCRCRSPILLQRTSKLFEPLKYEICRNVCSYKVPEETSKNIYSRRFIYSQWMPGKYVAYCKKCESNNPSLKDCAYRGCHNKDEKGICLVHSCCVCGSYPHDEERWDGRNYITPRKMRQCKSCGKCYCVMSRGWYFTYFESECGSTVLNKCKLCYLKEGTDGLKMAIYENTPFYDEIVMILYEYARGFMFQCGNYVHCEQMICFEGKWVAEKQFDPTRERPKGSYYRYVVNDEQIVKRYEKYLTKIGVNYFRIICRKCEQENRVLKRCQNYKTYRNGCSHRRCAHKDVGIISMRAGRPRYVCLDHNDEIITRNPKCDSCSMSKPSINWFNTGLKECKLCKKKLCKNCSQNWHHCEPLPIEHKKVVRKRESDFDGCFNAELANARFAKDNDWWSDKWNAKNASRKNMKNKNKFKCKKRANKRKMH